MSTLKHRLEKLCIQLWDSGSHAVWNEDADEWEIRKRDGVLDSQDIPKVVMVGVLRLPTFNKRYRQIQPNEVYQELARGVDPRHIYVIYIGTKDLDTVYNMKNSDLQRSIEGTIRGTYANMFIVEEPIDSDITSE